MKKIFLSGLILSLISACSAHKYGIRGEPNPQEHVRVFLHPRLIISGFKLENRTKLVEQVNNEYTSFDFFIPSGEQEIDVRAIYTSGVYAFSSYSKAVTINAEKGDIVFVCSSMREISTRKPTGGNVQVLIDPKVIYFKTEEEKNKIFKNKNLNLDFFHESCNKLYY